MTLLTSPHTLGALAAFVVAATNAATADPALWYVTRAAAVCAYTLLTLAVDLGLLRSLAGQLGERASWLVDELHQLVSLLAAAFVALHLGALLLDPFITFSPANLLLPLAQPYRPLPVDLGVLALYALLAVLLSTWLRRRLSHGAWRGLHDAAFAAFALATVHGLFAGRDASAPWMAALYGAGAASVLFLVALRLLAHAARPAPDSTS